MAALDQEWDADESAFGFYGNWKEFLPIAATNLLLTLVTLGIYRFWATTRERRYFWSRTRFIDERLEWSGTGLELLIGFLLVLGLVFLPLFLLQFAAYGMMMRGQTLTLGILFALFYLFLFYLFGVAKFRALRYRLSRSWWRGIRGGSDDQGFGYGFSYLWKSVVGFLAFGLLVPWSMTSLWNQRWRLMSFGAHPFESKAFWGNIFLRYIICYLAPWVVLVGLFVAVFAAGMAVGMGNGGEPGVGFFAVVMFAFLSFYIIIPLFALAFYAAFMREAVSGLHLAGIDFAFTARTKHWILLFLGNAGLWLLALAVALVPAGALGLFAAMSELQPSGSLFADDPMTLVLVVIVFAVPFALVGPFIRYRTWRFGVRYLEAYGEIDADALSQSKTREPGQGEGLLDAFDIGAI